MYKVDVPLDYKEAAAVERRRMQEEQRKGRIFNAKLRQIGIDTNVLERQIQDKKQMVITEKIREDAFACDAIRNDKVALLMDERIKEDQRQVYQAVDEYRKEQQNAKSRREYDLYDPERLKKDLPARISDDDPRCTLSGLQKFHGEDLEASLRKKQQAQQLKQWTEQQAREKKQTFDNQKMADLLYGLKMIEMDQRALELEKMEEDCRKAAHEAITRYNEALLKENTVRQAYRKRQEEEDKRTELANNFYGDFLTENPAVAQSAFGGHRVIANRWKGMTSEEVAEIRKQQEVQRREAKRIKELERRKDEELDKRRVKQARECILLEREVEKKKRVVAQKLAEENLQLAKDQKNNQDFLNHSLYTNQPTSAYFLQFNTSTR